MAIMYAQRLLLVTDTQIIMSAFKVSLDTRDQNHKSLKSQWQNNFILWWSIMYGWKQHT